MERETIERLQIKTAKQRFLTVLEQESREAPRVPQALMVWPLSILPEGLAVCGTLPHYWCHLPCD